MQIRVYYEDTDMGGIVYHANYLKFCERARSEVFFQSGSTPHIEGGEFVAASLEAKFVASARLGDILDVTTEIVSLKGSSLLLRQKVLKDDIILFDMNIKLGFVKSGKIGRMSKDAQAHLRKLFTS
jgi:acyl-CoA thioester hydrolase